MKNRFLGNQKLGKQKAKDFYEQEAPDYIKKYRENVKTYPDALIRIKFVVELLKKNHIKTILDVGCGTCGSMIRLLKEGFDVEGFDFSKNMVAQGKQQLKKAGYDPNLIYFADLEDARSLKKKRYDAIIALGVFPHIIYERKALTNMHKLLKPKGLVLIEFRNALFAAYTLNKYSLDFFLNEVVDLPKLPQKVRDDVVSFYSERLKTDVPLKKSDGKLRYTDILAKFRNPLNIGQELFNPCGFLVNNMHFYHYHALPPIFRSKYPKLFRELSLKMEKINDWKGYLMASAYVVEARKNK